MAAPISLSERYEVGDILEDSKSPGNFIKIIAARETGYTFQFIDPENGTVFGHQVKTETLNDIRTFTYFKKV